MGNSGMVRLLFKQFKNKPAKLILMILFLTVATLQLIIDIV